jgi:prepilin-type N-terminal cleavage/methylation domain-containing protein
MLHKASYNYLLKPLESRGFSLAEVLVSMALLSLVTLASMSANQILLQSTSYGESSQGLLSLASSLRMHSSYTDLCTAALGSISSYNQNKFNAANPEVRMRLQNINAGLSMNENWLGQGQIVPALRLRINSLKLDNLRLVSGNKYIAELTMAASQLNGVSYKPIRVSSVQIEINGTSPNASIVKCLGLESGINESSCMSMGCSWNASQPTKCDCDPPTGLCPAGELPISIKQGVVDCRPLGGKPCGANQYLIGVSIEKSICAPVF